MEKIPYLQCLLLLGHFGAHFCFELKSETETIKGTTVRLVCSIEPSSFTRVISLFKDGNFKTSCDNANACSPASTDSGRYQYTSNTSAVTVEISSLNHASDAGAWRCTIGGSTSDYTLVVQSNPSSTVILKTIPDANVTKDITEVEVSATCYCIYPAVTEINILYRTKSTEDFKILERIPQASFSSTSNPGHSCLAYEIKMTVSNYTVSVENNPVALSNQNDVYFKVQFGNFITGAVGPFDFIAKMNPTEACTGAFECGFCPILIVVVSSVIICILMWKEVPKRIGGFSTVKIVIIVIFSVVAIGIGLGLGLGLREGEENCLNCGATIGISISLGVALSVMQFAIIFNCNNEKGCKDSKRVTSDRSNGDRARTPTSASGVTMEAKKKSLNKPTEKGTEVSSLNTKPVGHPLPETPNGRKNQLEPIKTDSVEVDNSAREKKKKKKKKEKKEKKEEKERKEEEKKENSEEEGQRPELQF